MAARTASRTRYWLYVLLATSFCRPGTSQPTKGGMSVALFQGLPHVWQLECSDGQLDSDVDIFSMTLYEAGAMSSVLASVNLKTRECFTSDHFSACQLDERHLRKSRLKTLVIGLRAEDSRVYGCNLTCLKAKAFGSVISWTYVITGKGIAQFSCSRKHNTCTRMAVAFTASGKADDRLEYKSMKNEKC